jgi:hypothetical protein
MDFPKDPPILALPLTNSNEHFRGKTNRKKMYGIPLDA